MIQGRRPGCLVITLALELEGSAKAIEALAKLFFVSS
jgi:hypothetical protein